MTMRFGRRLRGAALTAALAILVLAVSPRNSSAGQPRWRICLSASGEALMNTGETRTVFNDYSETAELASPYVEADADTPPFWGADLQVSGVRSVSDRWSLGVGLRVSRQGYRGGAHATYRDPIYQRTALTRIEDNVSIDVISVPVWARFHAGRNSHLDLGLILGIPLAGSRSVTLSREVRINGEESAALSGPTETIESELEGDLRPIVPGVQVAAGWALSRRIDGNIGVRYLGEAANIYERSTSGLALSVGLDFWISTLDPSTE